MKYDICHASKDFIRESGVLIDSLIYSETKAMQASEKCSVTDSLCAMLIPIFKVGEEMSESLLLLSSYEPLISIADMAREELFLMREKLKSNTCSLSSAEENEIFTEKSEKILKRLFDDLLSSDISERLCCDYLRYMICFLEGAVRLCRCASENEKHEDILILESSVGNKCRDLMHQMKGLLAMII